MRVFAYRNGAERAGWQPAIRQPDDAIWPPKSRAYGGQTESVWLRVRPLAHAAARLALPVALLGILLTAAYLYSDDRLALDGAPRAVRRGFVVMSDLVVPVAWLCIHLTNRRYGAAYAFAQLAAALALCLMLWLTHPAWLESWIGAPPLVTTRAVLAFMASFLAATMVGIAVFEGARGPRWWTAPLAGSFATALLFSLLYYPLAFAGTGLDWPQAVPVHYGLFFGESILLLLAYWLLRPAMRPLPGLNGY